MAKLISKDRGIDIKGQGRLKRPVMGAWRAGLHIYDDSKGVDLMTLQPEREHPHGLPDKEFDAIFTTDRPIIFAFHGYPWLIHLLTYRRTNHKNLHVRGYKEEGTTTGST